MSHVSPFLNNIFGDTLEIKHFHLYCGLGGFAAGVNQSNPRLGNLEARYRCLGGIDVDPAGIKDFEKLTGTKGTVMDMFSREQYTAFHGKEPPAGWREATPDDIRRAAGNEAPDVVFLSAPCKGFSGLLAEDKSKSAKYQALNQLALRGLFLTLEAFKDDLPALWGFENVPRIQSRGRHLLDQITAMFRHYGYLVAETTHDCGEIGNLGQSRKRFLMVARLAEKVPNFLYEPEKHPLRSVGEVIGRFPFPGDVERAGPMHRIPALQWKTWVRLAFVPPGKDWRALNKLAVENGVLRDFGLVPEYHHGYLGVQSWNRNSGAITSRSGPSNGAFAVDDPRGETFKGGRGVLDWNKHSGAVAGESLPSNGAFSVADVRFKGYGSVPSDTYHQYGVKRFEDVASTVTGQKSPGQGAISVADPRLPVANAKLVCYIRAIDDTWHRPFTTLELAALQGLVEPEEHLELEGLSDSAWRERIGNAVPPPTAKAIAEEIGRTLLMAHAGETFTLGSTPIWVRNVAIALSVAQPELQQ